jgi:transcriptional regulator
MSASINRRGWTHAEIAELLGVTPQAVMQIEKRDLAKCRKAFKRLGVSTEDVTEIRTPEVDTVEKNV